MLALGEPERAVVLLQQAARDLPRDPEIWNDLGLAQVAAGSWREAIASFETGIRAAPHAFAAHLNLAVVCMRHGLTGRAETEFEEAVRAAPREPLVYWNYGAALADVGDFGGAREHLKQALELDPDCGPAHAELGRVESSRGNAALALTHFARAESLGVDSAAFLANYGLELLRARRVVAAELALQRAVGQDSSRAAVWNHLGAARLELGREAEALAALRRARVLDPGNQDFRFNLASLLFRQQRWPDVVREVSNPRPERADLLDLWGMALREIDGPRAALPLLREASERAPRDLRILNNYGVVQAEDGQVEAARQTWRRVLEIDPDNATARQNLQASGGLPPGAPHAP